MEIMIFAVIGEISSGRETVANFFIKNLDCKPMINYKKNSKYYEILKNENNQNIQNNLNQNNQNENDTSLNELSGIINSPNIANKNKNNLINIEEDLLLSSLTTVSISENNTNNGFNNFRNSNSNLSLRDKIRKSKDKRIVIYPELEYSDFLELRNKGAFKLINIYSPFNKRFQNFSEKTKNNNLKFSLQNFIELDSVTSYDPDFHMLRDNANCHLYNNANIESLELKWKEMTDEVFNYYRPSWDDYFMSVAHILADRSNCIKMKVGAVLVKNGRILSTGYNGTPKGIKNCYEGGCSRCNDKEITQGMALDTCWCIHAEQNALLEIGRKECAGATLYTTVFPCLMCSKLIIECEVKYIIYYKDYQSDHSKKMLKNSKCEVSKWNGGFNRYFCEKINFEKECNNGNEDFVI